MSFSSIAELTTERLEAELCQQAAHLDAALCRWLLVLAEFDKREAFNSWECVSAAHFLNWRCGIAIRTGREYLRVARRLLELPVVTEAFSLGEISYSKARVLTRIATPETEVALVELARHLTVSQLQRLSRGYRFVERRDGGELAEKEQIRIAQDYDGGLASLQGRLSAEDAAIFSAALERTRRELESEMSTDGSREPSADKQDAEDSVEKPRRPTNVDAFRAMCETIVASGPKPTAGPDRTRVVVHVHSDTGKGHLHDGPELDPQTVRRLCCDAGGYEVNVDRTMPIDLGRRTREPSAKQRLYLSVRDGGCVFPGCTQRRYVDAHHVVHWLDGGPTDVSNLVLLCHRHHHAVHQGGYQVELTTTGARWLRPDGSPLDDTAHAATLDGPGVIEQNERLGLPITPDTPVAKWDGSNLDVSWCLESLEAQENRARSSPEQSA